MAGSVNKVILIGNLGRDPEVRRTSAGDAIVSFSLAMTESWRDKTTGERRDRTEWANIVVFNEQLGKIAEQYLKKGMKVYVEGQLATREFTDKDGNQRKSTEVVLQRYRGELTMLDSKGGRGEGGGDYVGGGTGADNASFGRASPMERGGDRAGGERRPAPASTSNRGGDIDDDIPF